MLRLDNGVRHDSRCGAGCGRCAERSVARCQGQLETVKKNAISVCTGRQSRGGSSGGAVMSERKASVVGFALRLVRRS